MTKEDRISAGSGRARRELLALVMVLAGILAVSCGSPGTGPGTAGEGANTGTGGTRTAAETLGNPSLGDEDAPVVMVEWGDFQ